ncbi:MAG: peptidyl-prolyl cis-trans isomerase [Thermoguttaceae bacterium]|nr:peptidyl-prolyl cis-trans isomerase [Thermoguttaceae bacterium]
MATSAKERSDGPTAANGGLRDWTSRGSLTAEILDRAIFGLPVGEMSPILEEDKLMHIVRVVERQEAQRTPFAEAQAEIREKIRKQRETAAREAFLARLRQQIPVWTVFDEEQAKKPLPGSLLIR